MPQNQDNKTLKRLSNTVYIHGNVRFLSLANLHLLSAYNAVFKLCFVETSIEGNEKQSCRKLLASQHSIDLILGA